MRGGEDNEGSKRWGTGTRKKQGEGRGWKVDEIFGDGLRKDGAEEEKPTNAGDIYIYRRAFIPLPRPTTFIIWTVLPPTLKALLLSCFATCSTQHCIVEAAAESEHERIEDDAGGWVCCGMG